jgi:hypothetical protein
MKLLSGSDLLDEIIAIGHHAITDYLDMTGDASAWDAPEFWLKSEIARKIYKKCQCYVYLEHRVRDLVKYADAGQLKGPRQTGRVDIVLYQKTSIASDASVMALIEIKKITNSWSFNEDADRLLDLGRLWPTAHLIVAGAFYCNDAKQFNDLSGEIEKAVSEVKGLIAPKIVSSPINADRWGIFSGVAGLVVHRGA